MSARATAANTDRGLAPQRNLAVVKLGGSVVRSPELPAWLDVIAASPRPIVIVPGGGALAGLATLLSILFILNLILFAFNLLPLPPMDGSAVVQLFMSDDAARWLQSFYRQPMIGWVGLLVAWQVFGRLFRPVLQFAVGLLFPSSI